MRFFLTVFSLQSIHLSSYIILKSVISLRSFNHEFTRFEKKHYPWSDLTHKVLLQFSWRRGSKDSRGQGFKGLFSIDFISAFNILSISAMSFFSVPNSPFSIKSKSPANNTCASSSQTENRVRMTFARLSSLCNLLAFLSACSVEDHSNPWPRPINLTILSINYHYY